MGIDMKIEIKNYTKKIKGIRVLDGIDLSLKSGNIYGLKGVNGSGKTMLMRAVCGLILPTSGQVWIDGKELGKDISFPESVGLLLENPSFISNYTGFKNLKMIADLKGKIDDEAIREALSLVGLEPDDKRTFKKYSLGMKQKLGIACAIMENPDLILLDEPTNALDEKGVAMVRDILVNRRNQGALILLACHDKEQLEFLSDEIIEIYEGKIVHL